MFVEYFAHRASLFPERRPKPEGATDLQLGTPEMGEDPCIYIYIWYYIMFHIMCICVYIYIYIHNIKRNVMVLYDMSTYI